MIEVTQRKSPVKRQPTALLGSDTSPHVQRMQIALWRRMRPLEKARAVAEVSGSVRELSLAGILQRYPEASEKECRLRYALLTLGSDLALKVYPDVDGLPGS